MKVLIAEDDRFSRRMLEEQLTRWGYTVLAAQDGAEAWVLLQIPDGPEIAVLDWMMPEIDGLELCRRCRAHPRLKSMHLLMLTAKGDTPSIVEALEAGADDYIVKPFHQAELRARIHAGARIVELRNELNERIRDLQKAHLEVRQLQGLLPICSYCKRIRDAASQWQNLESFITTHSDTQISHGICPDCYERVVKPEIDQIIAEETARKLADDKS